MSEKHYNISYLEDTGKILKDLKEYSYNPFKSLNDGTVIDLGCGTGMDILKMSEQLNPALKLIGIDHDPQMIAKASENLNESANIKFIHSEVYPLNFDTDSIAGVRTERMVQHLKEPTKTINEIYRVLKKDHPFVIVETDWASLTFYSDQTKTSKKICDYLTEIKVNNGMAAKKLTHYLAENKFRNISFEIFPFVLKSLKDANDYLWIEIILEEAKEAGFITTVEHTTFVNGIREADSKKYFSCSINLVLATSIK